MMRRRPQSNRPALLSERLEDFLEITKDAPRYGGDSAVECALIGGYIKAAQELEHELDVHALAARIPYELAREELGECKEEE